MVETSDDGVVDEKKKKLRVLVFSKTSELKPEWTLVRIKGDTDSIQILKKYPIPGRL